MKKKKEKTKDPTVTFGPSNCNRPLFKIETFIKSLMKNN